MRKMERAAPVFQIGQRVRVILNEQNQTPHQGTVREVIWHHKDQRYNYYLEEAGKKVSKRYLKEDLEEMRNDDCCSATARFL